MAIIRDEAQFEDYLLGTLPSLIPSDVKARYPNDKTGQINTVLGKNPLLFDRYLSDAIEVDVDCLCDGKDVFVAGIMEHIEEAGIHSGDSACSLPPRSLSPEILAELERQTKALALALDVGGLMNVQYAIKDGDIYVLEVNPRASRTVPFVAKVIGEPIAKIAARIMAGESLASFGLSPKELDHIGVKEAVFPFARFPGVDVLLGPEMRSTGEVIGLDRSFGVAFAKSQLGSGTQVPQDRDALRLGSRQRQGAHPADHADAGRNRLPDRRDRRHPALPGGERRQGDAGSTRCWKAARMSSTPSRTATSSSSSTPPRAPARSRIPARCARPPSCIRCPTIPLLQGDRGGRGHQGLSRRRSRGSAAAGLFRLRRRPLDGTAKLLASFR